MTRRESTAPLSPLQAHVLRVIAARGGTVSIVNGTPRLGWSTASFAARTVRALAKAGQIVKTADLGEVYRLASTQQHAPHAAK